MGESDDSMIKFSLIRRGGLELHSIFSFFHHAEFTSAIMRKEDMFMNKKRIMSLISILVPVAIAAIGEFSDQLDAKKQEEEIEDINKRIEALEAKQNEEA